MFEYVKINECLLKMWTMMMMMIDTMLDTSITLSFCSVYWSVKMDL